MCFKVNFNKIESEGSVVWNFEFESLGFICILVIGAWNFHDYSAASTPDSWGLSSKIGSIQIRLSEGTALPEQVQTSFFY